MSVELADVFRQYGPQYRQKYGERMPVHHHQVMRAIEQCRTEALGGHIYRCPECDEVQYHYHSCRDRHCPKCQQQNAELWLEKQREMLLPVPYFLLTFTLPAELRPVARSHPTLLYNLLFRVSAEATQRLARDPRFVGGQIGMVGVLHTWGRNLSYHPHVHYLIPAGGLAEDGQTWLPARKNFLLPVKALSRIFRACFRQALRKTAYSDQVPPSAWKRKWVVHCKPVGDGLPALKYLAPYIFRVAISNNRILKLADGKVTFRYRDTDTGKTRLCTLQAEEFIRRFLQHVLPKGFVKVRYYGLFSPGCRERLASAQRQLEEIHPDQPLPLENAVRTQQSTDPQASALSSDHSVRCPQCGSVMQVWQVIQPHRNRPP